MNFTCYLQSDMDPRELRGLKTSASWDLLKTSLQPHGNFPKERTFTVQITSAGTDGAFFGRKGLRDEYGENIDPFFCGASCKEKP